MTHLEQLNMYFEFYGPLLTDKQYQVMELWLKEDYSLSEISDLSNSSRQAVHDIIKRSTDKLVEYEEKLHLNELLDRNRKKLSEVKQLLHSIEKTSPQEYGKILSLLEDIIY